ncbi:hypothetical protein K1719_041689 [Acacia pycnantha]|nr:hypothetical protein K1719_041689 [Acacia pycnantha]
MDPYKFLHIVLNPDGTITRLEKHPETPAQPDPNPHLPVLSKDLSINPLRNTWARIFLPHQAPDHSSSSSITKLPMIVFYHAGGFIDYAANTTYFHDFAFKLLKEPNPSSFRELPPSSEHSCRLHMMMLWRRCIGSEPPRKSG